MSKNNLSKPIVFAVAFAALSTTALSGAVLAQSKMDNKAGTPSATQPSSMQPSATPAQTTGQATDQMKMDKPNASASDSTGNAGMKTDMKADMKSDMEKGIVEANSATMAVRFVSLTSAHMTTSKLIGLNVYNNKNESLGEIEDLVIDNGRTISGVIISVGGVLGIGENYVVVEPSSVVVAKKDNKWRAYIDTTKDSLKNAPKFKYEKRNS